VWYLSHRYSHRSQRTTSLSLLSFLSNGDIIVATKIANRMPNLSKMLGKK
jgi:hypothetical protein